MSPAEEEIVGMNHVKFAADLSTAVQAGYASAFGAVRPDNHHLILKGMSMLRSPGWSNSQFLATDGGGCSLVLATAHS